MAESFSAGLTVAGRSLLGPHHLGGRGHGGRRRLLPAPPCQPQGLGPFFERDRAWRDAADHLCFLPVAARVVHELRRASWRAWLALVAITAGPQAFATVLFTQSLTYAFGPSLTHAASIGIQSEVYLLYLLQPVFGTTMAWLFLRERRPTSSGPSPP